MLLLRNGGEMSQRMLRNVINGESVASQSDPTALVNPDDR